VGTALIYLLVVVAVAAAVFGVAAAVFGRGEELAPLPPGPTPSRLPDGEVAGDDVRALRFPQAVRGYRMAEVDWALDRLAAELDRTAAERDHLRARLAESGAPGHGFVEDRVFPEDGVADVRIGDAESVRSKEWRE
jgi:DivIVA domain-containing protein